MTGGMKQQKGMQAKDQQREITGEVRTLLGKKAACFNSFGGGNPAGAVGFTVPAIRDDSLPAPGVARYTRNLNDKTNMLKFDDFRVHSFIVDPSDATQGLATLEVKLSKVGDVGTVKELQPDLITLKVKLNAGNIIECVSLGTRADSVWQTSPGNLMDVYYNGGRVGIGTDAPISRLEVANTGSGGNGFTLSIPTTGNAPFITWKTGDAANNLFSMRYFGGAAGSFGIGLGDSSSWSPYFNITSIGNVGIGTLTPTAKLDVAGNLAATGSIKPGAASTGAVCSPRGAFAYDFGTDAPVFCNGTNWTSMGGALTSYSGANPGCPGGTSPFLKHWPAQWVPVNGVGAGCMTPEGWTGPPPVCEGCNNFEQCHFGYATSWDSVICR